MILLAVTLALLLVDAEPASPKHIPVYVDSTFSAQDRADIATALEHWNTTMRGLVVLDTVNMFALPLIDEIKDVEEHHGLLLLKVGSDHALRPKAVPPNLPPVAWADALGGTKTWFIRSEIFDTQFEVIVEHEIGHVLGADHRSDHPNVMYPYTDPRMQIGCLEQASADEISTLQGVWRFPGTCR